MDRWGVIDFPETVRIPFGSHSRRDLNDTRSLFLQVVCHIPYNADVLSMFGRHETIPDFQKQQKIRNVIAIAIGILALITPYGLIAIFSGFQAGTLSTPCNEILSCCGWWVVRFSEH